MAVRAVCVSLCTDDSLENDIALLKLESPLDLSGDKVKAIALNTANGCPRDGQQCRVAGWGVLGSGRWSIQSFASFVGRVLLRL